MNEYNIDLITNVFSLVFGVGFTFLNFFSIFMVDYYWLNKMKMNIANPGVIWYFVFKI